MTPQIRKLLWGALLVGLGGLGLWAYLHYVWYAGPTMTWQRKGVDYELLAPRMLGIVLLVPYFLWMIGRSLADLPPAQRALSVLLRVAFLALLAMGLARLARTATTQKVCTVYVADVSDSVPDAALQDARDEVQRALDAKPKDDLLRLVTFAKRPRVVTLADDEKKAPEIARHGPGLGGATDIASALQLSYGLFPEGYLRRVVVLSDGVQTDGDLLAEANRARSYGVKLYAVPYRRPVPGEVAVRDLRVPDKIHEGETFDVHAQIFSSVPQTV
jgi:Ca-activated chloride channel family protein